MHIQYYAMLIERNDICYSDINSTAWEDLTSIAILYDALENHVLL